MTHPEHRQALGVRIIPSILNAGFASLRREIGRAPEADGMHVDVMDNHFVPDLTIGLPVVECLRKVTDQLLNIHPMIEDPDCWVSAYAEAGTESVTFRAEAAHAPIRLARELWTRGARASMTPKPAAPIEPYAKMFDKLDMVLLMTAEPDFGGQKFLGLVLPKIRRTRELIGDRPIWFQVDGGISVEAVGRCTEAGADTFVAGSAVCNAPDPDAMVRELRELADSAWYC